MIAADLRARAGLRLGRGRWLIPPWTAPALLGCAVVLIPWTAFLFVTLPRHYEANHWALAWGGFDVGLALALGATAVMVARRSPFAEVTATITGSLLCCDAWFDVLTSRGTAAVVQALISALLIELPLAGLCFWMARNLAHAVEVVRPFLQAAGFTIAGNKLVPPSRKDVAMSDFTQDDDHHDAESPLLRAQEHKGYGEDEGEREALLEQESDNQEKPAS